MNHPSQTTSDSRRQFLASSAAAVGGAMITQATLMSTTPAASLAADEKPKSSKYKKAVKIGMVQAGNSLMEKFKLLADLGFDGIELDSPGGASAEEVQKCIAETGLKVPGVVDSVHWKDCLSDPSAEVRAKGVAALEEALKMCKAYGGTSCLLVPGRVTKEVTHEQAFERSVAEIKKVLPLAEKLNIEILIENVWNDFLTDPKEMARFIDACESKLVGAHFDIGNTIRYSPSHEWIPILGHRIKKLDIKDFKKGEKGFGAKLMEGDVDWPQCMRELEKIGYTGWGTAEIQGGGREWLTDVAARMDKIFAS